VEDVLDLVRAQRLKPGHDDGEPTIETESHGPPVESAPQSKPRAEPRSISSSTLLSHPDAHPIALDLLLLRGFGPSWLRWEPETLLVRAGELKCGALSEANFSKLQACKTLHLTGGFWQQWEIFALCAAAFDGEPPSAESLRVPSVVQCALAVDVAGQIRDDVPWSEEVRQFLSQLFRFEGVLFPVEPCLFVPRPVEGLPIDLASVEGALDGVLASGKAPQGDTVEAEQLRRSLALHKEIEAERARFIDQRRLVEYVPFRPL
jgi:hypothetical protein